MIQYEIKVTGRVQGVGYRYYARNQARSLNLCGWVRNSLDGGVLIVAQGFGHALTTFIDYLWIGPPMSQVKSITKTETTILEEFSDFEIKH